MPFSQVLFVSIYLYLNFVWLLHNILTRTEFTCNHDYEEGGREGVTSMTESDVMLMKIASPMCCRFCLKM